METNNVETISMVFRSGLWIILNTILFTGTALKLHLANFSNLNRFTAYGENYVAINQIRHEQSLVIFPDQLIKDWPVNTVDQLRIEHFDCVLPHSPEILILGTGTQHQFPDRSLLKQLMQSGFGIEIMNTQACCRTYNILVEEGRRVAAAIPI